MYFRPVFLTFFVAAAGAALVGVVFGFAPGRADWPALLTGAVCTAAIAGIVQSVVQFLPNRHYGAVAVISGIAVAATVSVLLRAGEVIGFGSAPLATVFAWFGAVVLGLIVTRESGHRLPPVRRP